jgi:surface protein
MKTQLTQPTKWPSFLRLLMVWIPILLLLLGGRKAEAQITPGSADNFIITVKSDNPGTSSSTQFTIPTTGGGYNYSVYWENTTNPADNGTINGRTGNYTIPFSTTGTYRVEITGAFPRIFFNNGGDRLKLLRINQWGTNAWTSMAHAFQGCFNMELIAQDAPNLLSATSLSYMFQACTSLTGFNANWNWNTSSITDMSWLFLQAFVFNADISMWNTSNVTNMNHMFAVATDFNQDISNWDVGKVTNMEAMFAVAVRFNQNLGAWNIRSVTNMSRIFANNRIDQCNYDATLIGWNQGRIQNGWTNRPIMDRLLQDGRAPDYCSSAQARSELIDAGWVISGDRNRCNTVNAQTTYTSTPTLTGTYTPMLGSYLAVTVNGVKYIQGDPSLSISGLNWTLSIPPANPIPAGVYDVIVETYQTAYKTSNPDYPCADNTTNELIIPILPDNSANFVTTWKTDNPGTSGSNQIRIPTTGAGYNFNVYWVDVNNPASNGTLTGLGANPTITFPTAGTYRVEITGDFPRIYFNFSGDRQKLLEINQWGTNAWTSMANAFQGCVNMELTAQDVPNLSLVTSMNRMFTSSTSLTGASANWNWNTSSVTDMYLLFGQDTNFNGNIGAWNTSNVTVMAEMFLNASSFNQPIGNWNTGNVANMLDMFNGATSFNQPIK